MFTTLNTVRILTFPVFSFVVVFHGSEFDSDEGSSAFSTKFSSSATLTSTATSESKSFSVRSSSAFSEYYMLCCSRS